MNADPDPQPCFLFKINNIMLDPDPNSMYLDPQHCSPVPGSVKGNFIGLAKGEEGEIYTILHTSDSLHIRYLT